MLAMNASSHAGFVVALVALSTFAGLGSSKSVNAMPPVRVCEIRQSTWCIYAGDITIQHRLSSDVEYRSVWSIWGRYWADHPAVVLEPSGCRNGHSDQIRLIEHDVGFEWSGRKWDSVVVRLKVDGTCDLRLLSPAKGEDPRQSAFSAKLTLIQTCLTDLCEGVVVAREVLPELSGIL